MLVLGALLTGPAVSSAAPAAPPAAEPKPEPKPEPKAEPNPEPSPAETAAAAEKLYRDVYGAEHDRASAARDPKEKIDFARKLIEASKIVAADDPVFAFLLRTRAVEFAESHASGYDLAAGILRQMAHNAKAIERRIELLEKLADLQLKPRVAETAGKRTDRFTDLVEILRELSRTYAGAGDFAKAEATLDRAKTSSRNDAGTRSMVNVLAQDEKDLETAKQARREFDIALKILQVSPGDEAANRTVGLTLLLDQNKPAEAAPHLVKAGEAFRGLGEALAAEAPEELKLGDGARTAWGAVSAPVHKRRLGGMARVHYEAFLKKEPTHPEAVRVKLILPQLPQPETGDGPSGPVDLLAMIDPAKNGGRSDWKLEDKTLVSPKTGKLSLPYDVPDEYDLRIVLVRRAGEGELAIGLPGALGRRVVAVFDHTIVVPRGKKRQTLHVSGFDSVDGRALGTEQNSPVRDDRAVLLERRPVELLFRVRRNGVSVVSGKRELFAHNGELRRLSFGLKWDVAEKSSPWLVAAGSVFQISKIELTPLSPGGRPLE
jgi:tetratricopeptide (TPR) repeat protein